MNDEQDELGGNAKSDARDFSVDVGAKHNDYKKVLAADEGGWSNTAVNANPSASV